MSIRDSLRLRLSNRAAHRLLMIEYAAGIDAARFPYFCTATGELGDSLGYVIRATFTDWRAFRVLHRWHSVRRYQKGW